MPVDQIVLLLAAAFAAGALNAAAGGGSFLTLPALVFVGVPPVMANATGTAALLPGYMAGTWGFRDDLQAPVGISIPTLVLVTFIAGTCGAALLLVTEEAAFDALIPWLLLAATVLFAAGPALQRYLAARNADRMPRARAILILAAVSLYGGYFNGGLGIMLLATFSLLGETRLNTMNALKGVVSVLLTVVSVVVYQAGGLILWPEALTMMAGAVAGGYLGARFIRRLPEKLVRIGVVGVGIAMTTVFFLRA